MTDKAKQIEKIRKLLALAAQSSNDGEPEDDLYRFHVRKGIGSVSSGQSPQ